MDASYFHERVLVSPLFQMIPLKRKKHDEIMGAFGNTFEDYCCDIMKRMFPEHSNHLLMCQRYDEEHKEKLEIDAAIKQNDKAIILIELKKPPW